MLLNRKTKWDGTINLPYVLEIVHFENSLAFAITNTLRYRKVLFADVNVHLKIIVLWSPPQFQNINSAWAASGLLNKNHVSFYWGLSEFLIWQHLDKDLLWPDYFSCEVWGDQQIVASQMTNLLAPTLNAHAWLGALCSPTVIWAWLKLGCAMDFKGPCQEKLFSLPITPSRHVPRKLETDWWGRGSCATAQSHQLDECWGGRKHEDSCFRFNFPGSC